MAHQFAKKHFSKPTWCAHCEKFIWGLGKQGYSCKVCSYPCHPKCTALVEANCPGKKTKWGKKTLEEAKSRVEPEPQAKQRRPTQSRADRPPPKVEPIVVGDDESSEESESLPTPKNESKLSAQPSLSRISQGKIEKVAESIEDVYEIGKELGSGAFSVVKSCVHKATGEIYAVKIIRKENVKQDLHRLAIEMQVLETVKHPNIIELKEVFETPTMLYIVTEQVTGGELFDRIVNKGSYTEKDAADLVIKFLEAIEYLHDKGIVHRDLKPENLLLKSKDNDTDIKLADFGLSKIVGQEVLMQTACGTPGYVAPEILQAKGYGKEVDLWSVGVITYILMCGFPPFYNDNVPLLFESIMKAEFDYPAEYWDHISDDAIDFIDALLVVEPEHRLTARQALEHPWLKSAPSTPLQAVSGRMRSYTNSYKENASGPSSVEDM
eukprot:CAMPEP_0206199686 /NCGR_PEP_ID=MMETSP0166-20121206/10413_1 /ASSEMBLY_ACC=CAM_ASM_000260 /TAXON_ID=95228 /ORGANISM="Vannella robusta, Strain DIVA3 518/3/11/1/6" /LENGTH=436 /DNA_ID=CAMNT_0053617843 /DNA_START=1056 /DNA_END=2363 /DNA_ORIENTATION=+